MTDGTDDVSTFSCGNTTQHLHPGTDTRLLFSFLLSRLLFISPCCPHVKFGVALAHAGVRGFV